MAITALINLSDADAGWGVVSYNGYTFPGLRDFKLVGEEVLDDAKRAVLFTRYTLTIHCYSVDSSLINHNTTIANLRTQLQEAGGVLTVTSTGVADIVIGPGGVADVDWGPKPQILELTQIGQVGTEIVWSVTFSIKEATISAGSALAFNFGVEWSYDDAGIGTRVYSGYVQIAQSRIGNTVSKSADSFRNRIDVKTPLGMQRTGRRFSLSPDKNRLDFSITDKQLEAEAPPPNCLRAEIDYEVENTEAYGFAQFYATLSGSIELPWGVPPNRAAEAFMNIYLDKYKALQKAGDGSQGNVMPLKIRFGRTMTTRVTRFSAVFLVTKCLNDLLSNGGIWEPIPTSDYAKWAQSLQSANAWNNNGTNGLFFNPAEDSIVDLGTNTRSFVLGAGGGNLPNFNAGLSKPFSVKPIGVIAYRNKYSPYRAYNEVKHYSANQGPTRSDREKIDGSPGTTTQTRGSPAEYVLMQGQSMTVGQKPDVPFLNTFNGRAVRAVKLKFDGPNAVACVFDNTVYSMRWAMLYRLTDQYISGYQVATNKAICCAPADETVPA